MKSVSAKRKRGHQTSKIVKSRQGYSNGHLLYHCAFDYFAHVCSFMTWHEFT